MPHRIAEQPALPTPLQPYSAALLNQQPLKQHDNDGDNMAIDDVKPAALASQAEAVQPHASTDSAAVMDVDAHAGGALEPENATCTPTSTTTTILGKSSSALIDELFASSDTEEDEDKMDASDSASSSPSSLATIIKICTRNDDRMEVLDSEEEGEDDEEEDDEYETASSSDEDSDSDDDSSDDGENGGRRRKRARLSSKSTKRKGQRKGLPSQAEMKEAEEQDPDYNALATLVQFLQGADATSAEVMEEHLKPREMVRPFQEVQVAAIHAKAASMPPKVVKLKEEQPKPYKKVRRMVYHASMKGEVDIFKDDSNDHQCQCLSVEEAAALPPASREDRGVCCDEMCLNRSLNVECSDDCRFAATGECKNQRIGRRLQAPFRVFRTEGRGWGVAAVENVEVGTLVSEYVGEVIDDEEVARRLWLAKEEEGEGADFYMVEAVGATVDARHFGNESRFLNHSCEPNCTMEKWNVGGCYRLGIFAIKPIPAGTEYCWDYQFSNFEGSKPKACRCGAATCRKVLAGKAYRDEAAAQAQVQAPVSVRVEKLQRAVQEAEAFRAMLRGKPLHDLDPLVLFFNGRTAPEEMRQAQQARLWLTKDGPGVAAREKERTERAQRKAAAAAAAVAAAAVPAQGGTAPASIPTTATTNKPTDTTTITSSSSTTTTTSQLLLNKALQARLDVMLAAAAKEAEAMEKQRAEAAAAAAETATTKKGGKKKGAGGKDAAELQKEEEEERQAFQRRVQAKVLGELTELAVQRGKKALMSTGRRYSPRRLGLLSLREKRWNEANFLPFAEKLVGEARMQGWHESRWQAVSDMIVFMKQSESKGLWGDMSEDICYSCGCSGDLVCCDACTSAYHVSCAGLYEVPDESQWFCTRCKRKAGGGSRRQR